MARRLKDLDELTSPTTPGGVDLAAGWQRVLASWRDDATVAEQTGARLTQIGERFAVRLERSGVRTWDGVTQAQCWSFITAATRTGTPPSVATQHLRRSTVRAVFRTLRASGACTGDPSLDLRLPPRQPQTYRPLTDDEVTLCRAASRLGEAGTASLRRAVAWALGEATASTSEIGAIRIDQLDDPHNPRRVRLPASRRYAAREGLLSDWGRQVIRRHAVALLTGGAPPHALLAYAGSGAPGQYLAQASVCTQITKVLEVAGLRDDPAVRARSLRGWAGHTLYGQGLPLEVVAVRLGCNSLDAAAAEIGLRWKP